MWTSETRGYSGGRERYPPALANLPSCHLRKKNAKEAMGNVVPGVNLPFLVSSAFTERGQALEMEEVPEEAVLSPVSFQVYS